jgi:hypothetical protein
MDKSILDETVIDEKLLVETIDLVLTDSSVRNLSIFSYALLKRFGITAMEIRTFFPSIGLQSEKSCRENLLQCKSLILERIAGVKQRQHSMKIFLRLKKLQNYLFLKKFKRKVAIFVFWICAIL